MEDQPEYIDRVTENAGLHNKAWQRTLDDMESIAETRREDGWEAATFQTLQTAPVSRADNDNPDRFGISTVLPDNHAEEFRELYENNDLDQYQVYSSEVEGFMYLVIEVLDLDAKTSVLFALRYDLTIGRGMFASVYEEDTIFTYVRTIDGTEIAVFEHEEYRPLLPEQAQPPTGARPSENADE